METKYTVYRITNKTSGKVYVGSHKTTNLDDGYMGSGKYLRHAIEKYGLENFQKDILHVFDTSEEMYAKEAELVNEEFLTNENTYNLKVGGFGGWDLVNSRPQTEEHKKKVSAALKAKGIKPPKSTYKDGRPSFAGKHHSEESKRKMGDANKGKIPWNKGIRWKKKQSRVSIASDAGVL